MLQWQIWKKIWPKIMFMFDKYLRLIRCFSAIRNVIKVQVLAFELFRCPKMGYCSWMWKNTAFVSITATENKIQPFMWQEKKTDEKFLGYSLQFFYFKFCYQAKRVSKRRKITKLKCSVKKMLILICYYCIFPLSHCEFAYFSIYHHPSKIASVLKAGRLSYF